jgi:alkyl hydroperoxide reductase 1
MPELKAGDSFPEGVSFTYVPPTPEQSDIVACGVGIKYEASKGKSPPT